eukprot:GCRY01003668.1.p1 GENE.GCRY01003668.1~~GCRY01003668.1.p1  ORF type:complete len:175 (-),score=30.69 GCRY01003668.1:75-572(-)
MEEQFNLFCEGARLIFQRWTLLRLAVSNEWGGVESTTYAEELFEDVMYIFKENAELYADEVEEYIDERISADFNCVDEDRSSRGVAEELLALSTEIKSGNLSKLEKLREDAAAGRVPSTVDCVCNESEDEGSDMEDVEEDKEDKEKKDRSRFTEPDDDGWVTVKK